MIKTIALLFIVLSFASADSGVDFSNYQGGPSQSVFNCFKQNGKTFLINQIWLGGYGINSNFEANWQKAKAAGIEYVDAYAFVCNNCDGNTASNVCSQIKAHLPSGFDGQVWLDIEDCSGCWTGTPADRLSFLEGVASTCEGEGMHLGVYSGYGSWGNVFGSPGFDGGALKKYPVWYSHYDGSASFSDWSSVRFGGFGNPNMKQYDGTTSFCGTSVDMNWY